MNEDGHMSSIKDKILSIDVSPGWKEGARIVFSKEGDQVKKPQYYHFNYILLSLTLNTIDKIHLKNGGKLCEPSGTGTSCCLL